MNNSEFKRALLGAALAPSVMVLVFPVASFIEAAFQKLDYPAGEYLGLAVAGSYFAYLGLLIFSVPMYFILRLLSRYPVLCIAASALAGAVAATITIPLLVADTDWFALRAEASLPSFWINSMPLSGACVGIAFFLIARPGKASRKIENGAC